MGKEYYRLRILAKDWVEGEEGCLKYPGFEMIRGVRRKGFELIEVIELK